MRNFSVFVVVMVMLGSACCTEVCADEGVVRKGEEAWGPCMHYARMYDRNAVETISGEVVSVGEFKPAKGMSCGIELLLKTDKETLPVHLGPEWYVEKQDVKVLVGDKVEAKGARIILEGKPAMIAAEVKKGDQTLTLRQVDGFPLWAKHVDWSRYHWGE